MTSAETPDGAEGIRVLISNRGHYPVNVDWLWIESQATTIRLPFAMRRNVWSMNTPTAAQIASNISDVIRFAPHPHVVLWRVAPIPAALAAELAPKG
jgi:hypothetical protein